MYEGSVEKTLLRFKMSRINVLLTHQIRIVENINNKWWLNY